MSGYQNNIIRSEETTVDFLTKKLINLEKKIEQIEKTEPLNKLLLDYTRAAMDTKILIDKISFPGDTDREQKEARKRREDLSLFGAGLLNCVLPFVPNEQKDEAVRAASAYGESYLI